MRELTTEGVKENIRLSDAEAADRELVRLATESSSESEVLRQALRNTEQLLDDLDHGRRFEVVTTNRGAFFVRTDSFPDAKYDMSNLTRKSLIIHKLTKSRLEALRARLDVEDISAVARFSLRFMTLIVKEALEGSKFYVVAPGGMKVEIRFGVMSGRKEEAQGEPEGEPSHVERPLKVARR